MFSGSVRTESSSSSSQYDRRISYSGDHTATYGYSDRSHFEPPRPLEPRPTLHASLSDTTSMQRRQEPYPPVGNTSEYRPLGPSLPGLRDILTPGPTSSEATTYSNAWHTPTSVARQNRNQYASSYVHPPMVSEPHAQPQQDHRPRSWEVPVQVSASETAAQAAQSMPVSPYYRYPPDYGRSPENRYERSGQSASGAVFGNGLPSPYAGVAPESSPFRAHSNGCERNHIPPSSTASTENQKKYLGIRDVPGEGTFHFYEGGYRIPTHVDGEHVNPAWGLTKANKPRKRLALACLDCREKKIKCEPGATSCLQCEKAKRPCRRTQTQQSQAESVASTDWSPSIPTHPRTKASISDPNLTSSHDIEHNTLSKRRSREDPSPPNGAPNKKQRSASPLPAIIRDAPVTLRDTYTMDSTSKSAASHLRHAGGTSWEDDPYAIEPEVTLQLLDLYFAHFNSATYCLFPRRHFMHWLKTCPDKCQNERMVLYALLAMASVFAGDRLAGFGRQCARIALDILPLRVGTIHLCIAQARALLSCYCFARGEHDAAWEHSGAAIRAVQHLNYQTEQGCVDHAAIANQPRCEFSFSVMQRAECKRRTFWSAFFMDRFFQGTVTTLKPQDIFVRLPCPDEMFENGLPSDAPYLNNGIVDPIKALLTAGSSLSPMAWHAVVAAIWGDVIDFVFRAPHQAAASYNDTYESFYSDIWNRLQGWLTRLPEHLQYHPGNLERSIQRGYASTFISIHALYHLCCMKLNRCLRHQLAQGSISRNIRAAHDHGHQVLQLMGAVNVARREVDSPADGQASTFMISTPFVGYATLAAVDIVSAGGTDSALASTLDEISAGLTSLQELSRFWASARDQARLCERRYYQIQNILKNPVRAKGGAWLGRSWGLEKPLESELSPEDDCIYGLAEEVYFDALKDSHGHSRAGSGGLRIA